MEKYLNKCLDSLIVDNMDLLEVLVINDGSKDRSSEIAHEYEKKYPNTFRVIDKKNGNYGSCINSGIKNITGKYVKILDSDDSFDSNNLKEFLNVLTQIDADLVVSDYIILTDKHQYCNCNLKPNTLLQFNDYKDSELLSLGMHAITYKSQHIINSDYIQTEGISYTDQEWAWFPMKDVNSFYYYDKPIYLYLLGREGQTMEAATLIKKVNDQYVGIFKMIDDYLRISDIDDIHKCFLYKRLTSRIIWLYRFVLIENRKEKISSFITFDLELKKKNSEIYNYVENDILQRYFNFKYIKYWRNNKNCSIPFVIIILNCLLKRTKSFIRLFVGYFTNQ